MRKPEQSLNQRVASAFTLLVVALIGFWAGYLIHLTRLPRRPLTGQSTPLLLVQFVDVGDGDAAIASSPAGRAILLDAGPDADAGRAILAQLQRIHRTAPSAVLLTSTRLRSIGGAAYLLEHCPMAGIVVLPVQFAQFAKLGGLPARELLAAAKRRNIKVVAWQQYENSPDASAALSDANFVATPVPVPPNRGQAGALAVRLDLRVGTGTGGVFYAAGLSALNEDLLISQRARLPCDVLAASNGGHAGSLSSEYLALSGPDVVCVSCSASDPPDAAALERLKAADALLQRTDLLGTVAIGLTGQLGSQPIYYNAGATLPTGGK